MSYTSDLCCVECLIALPLGKWVTVNEYGQAVKGHWGGFRNGWDGRRVVGNEHSTSIAHFCAVHSGHMLGVISTERLIALLDETPTDEELFRWVVDVEEVGVKPEKQHTDLSHRFAKRLASILDP